MIFENPDDLGYFTEHQMAKARAETPKAWNLVSSLIVCNSLLSREEQAEITQAAYLMDNGYAMQAEQHRTFAGYDTAALRLDPR